MTYTSMCSFRMCKAMFIDICHAVAARNDYFKRKPNAAGLPGFTTVQKVTVALRLLAYGGCADRLVEYIRLGETTILESLDHFTRTVIDLYGQSYLRPPNAKDIARLLRKAEERGFPGMIGSIDCMPSLACQDLALASYDLRIWHAFFGNQHIAQTKRLLYKL